MIDSQIYLEDTIQTCLTLMSDFIEDNPTEISNPDFEDNMVDCIYELIMMDDPYETMHDLVYDAIQEALVLLYIHFIPPRSFSDTFTTGVKDVKHIKHQLAYLKGKPQPQQRTPEWYAFRQNLITASNAFKAFDSQSSQNQLIYEKCKAGTGENSAFTNVNSSLHWGQKYEPVSAMIYEETYSTKLMDLGCIQHETYLFLGASPDGINCLPDSKRFGRMLEIKNIVNREIDGIPKKEYWIQMQLQMETCDLEETDFLECRFIEYETEREFYEDGDFFISEYGERKGILMYFAGCDGNPYYVYKPLKMTSKEFHLWEMEQLQEKEKQGYTWIRNLYWRLEEMSCVLVLRNRKWFADNISQLQKIWNIIEKERDGDFSHREPKKRSQKDVRVQEKESTCFIHIHKEESIVVDVVSSSVHTTITKIRTESFDE